MSSQTVTFQPGGLTNTFPIFNLFGSLSAYITTQPSIQSWTILVDGSFASGSPAIETGVFPLPTAVAFVALANSNFASGAVSFVNFPYIQFNGSNPVFTVGAGLTLDVTLTYSTILAGYNPFFAATSGGNIVIFVQTFATIGSAPGPSPPVLTIDGSSTGAIVVLETGQVVAGAATVATGGSLQILLVDSASVDPSYQAAPGISVSLLSIASQVGYTPSTPSNWNPAPSQVAQALDQLGGRMGADPGGVTPEQFTALSAEVTALSGQVTVLSNQIVVLQEEQANLESMVETLKHLIFKYVNCEFCCCG
jgi:hypothetical protein